MIPMVDLFSGPGGLNEGFTRLGEDEGKPVFYPIASFEKEPHAVRTLRLRSVYRTLKRTEGVPEEYFAMCRGELTVEDFLDHHGFRSAAVAARSEVHALELGEATREESDAILSRAFAKHSQHGNSPWVLIGGPPCQAYSLVGRSRRRGDEDFEQDGKHFLYREYLNIVRKFRPTIFVMENVKGLLSSTNGGQPMFDRILSDLRHPGDNATYEIRSLVIGGDSAVLRPVDYVIRSEDFGIPQRRHRVILLGVDTNYRDALKKWRPLVKSFPISVGEAIGDLPRLRSQISPRRYDSPSSWNEIRDEALLGMQSLDGAPYDLTPGGPFIRGSCRVGEDRFSAWIMADRLDGVIQHEARSHIPDDLRRYAYLASVGETEMRSVSLSELPSHLTPNHRNAKGRMAPFQDRFRVQLGKQPSSTVVSHISKDGNYYIHPDPCQMRSLTVREAARLQTFPDDYLFLGPRTQQYVQVGNAVPPLLANQIAEVVAEMLGEYSAGASEV